MTTSTAQLYNSRLKISICASYSIISHTPHRKTHKCFRKFLSFVMASIYKDTSDWNANKSNGDEEKDHMFNY